MSERDPVWHLVVVGGGPAGVFAALAAREANPSARVALVEKEEVILSPWRHPDTLPGGLTREIWDPAELAGRLVDGVREMLGPYTRHGPGDVESWLEDHGLALEVDGQGRVHPADGSVALAAFFDEQLARADITVLAGQGLAAADAKSTGGFWLTLADERTLQAERIIVAGGGLACGPLRRVVEGFGHAVGECLPALTGLQCLDSRLRGLAGIGLTGARLRVGDTERQAEGVVRIEPWGFSGPAAWALTARQARTLAKLRGRFPLRVAWLPGARRGVARWLDERQRRAPGNRVAGDAPEGLPEVLWRNLLGEAGIDGESWDTLDTASRSSLLRELADGEYEVVKRKFVRGVTATAGGVLREEVDFRDGSSRRTTGLYFAGDALDVLAADPAENLQLAWTTGWQSGQAAVL